VRAELVVVAVSVTDTGTLVGAMVASVSEFVGIAFEALVADVKLLELTDTLHAGVGEAAKSGVVAKSIDALDVRVATGLVVRALVLPVAVAAAIVADISVEVLDTLTVAAKALDVSAEVVLDAELCVTVVPTAVEKVATGMRLGATVVDCGGIGKLMVVAIGFAGALLRALELVLSEDFSSVRLLFGSVPVATLKFAGAVHGGKVTPCCAARVSIYVRHTGENP